MSLLDRLEYRFGRLAIPGLIRYVVLCNTMVYVLYKFNPAFVYMLDLDRGAILQGQVWRLVTYVFIPQFGGFPLPEWLSVAMYLIFLWWVGNSLEHAIGSFKLNIYYLTGMIGITAAAFFCGAYFSAALLNTSLLFACAHYYPDEIIFVFYILPAKIKWLAWIAAALLLLRLQSGGLAYAVSLAVALSNYLLFFGPELYRSARTRQQVAERRQKFEAAKAAAPGETLHECVVCHRTEVTHPDLEFRVARDGQEYCLEHLPKPPAPVAQAG